MFVTCHHYFPIIHITIMSMSATKQMFSRSSDNHNYQLILYSESHEGTTLPYGNAVKNKPRLEISTLLDSYSLHTIYIFPAYDPGNSYATRNHRLIQNLKQTLPKQGAQIRFRGKRFSQKIAMHAHSLVTVQHLTPRRSRFSCTTATPFPSKHSLRIQHTASNNAASGTECLVTFGPRPRIEGNHRCHSLFTVSKHACPLQTLGYSLTEATTSNFLLPVIGIYQNDQIYGLLSARRVFQKVGVFWHQNQGKNIDKHGSKYYQQTVDLHAFMGNLRIQKCTECV